MRNLKIIFINNVPWVGGNPGPENFHGDAIYLALPDGTDILIDAATEVSGPHIAKKLRDMGVEKLDYFIASHLHTDHVNGLPAVADALPIKNVILSGYGKENITLSPFFFDTIEKHQIPTKELREGACFNIGDVNFKVFSPTIDAIEADHEMERTQQSEMMNNNSLVFRLSFAKFSGLFTGDIHIPAEEVLVEKYGDALKSTFLKVPHHGNDTSMGDAMLNCVKPRFAVSLGRACNGVIWRRFCNAETPLYATYTDGDIIAETDGNTLTVTCNKGSREYVL